MQLINMTKQLWKEEKFKQKSTCFSDKPNLASPEQNNSKHVFMTISTKTYLCPSYKCSKPAASFWPTKPVTYEQSQNTKLWTFSKYRLSPHFMSNVLSNPNTGWEVISEKCQQCKCFIHCPIPQSQWKHMLVSTLTPYIGPNYHVTSHLNSPSKNVISNYNILQAYNPNSLMSGRLKIHNWNKKYNSSFDYKIST